MCHPSNVNAFTKEAITADIRAIEATNVSEKPEDHKNVK